MSSAELWIMFFKSGKNLTFFSAFLFPLFSVSVYEQILFLEYL